MKPVFSIFLLLTAIPVLAQTKDSLIHRDLVLEKDYEPSIQSAGKIDIRPEIEALNNQGTKVQFALSETPSKAETEYQPLRAARTKTYYPAQDQKGYLRLGVGNHWSFLGDAQWTALRGPKQDLDLALWHRSAFGKIDLGDRQTNMKDADSRLQANYKLHLNTAVFKASLSNQLHFWNYYGSQQNTEYRSLPELQQSNHARLSLSLESKAWDRAFHYAIYSDGNLFSLRNALSSYIPSGLFGKISEWEWNAGIHAGYQLNEEWNLGLNGDFKQLSYQSSSNVQPDLSNLSWMELFPKISYQWNTWHFALGSRIAFSNSREAKLSPFASAEKTLGEKACFDAQIDGGQNVYSYREGFSINPYIESYKRIRPEYRPFSIAGRLHWKPFPYLRLTPFGGYALTKDAVQFYLRNLYLTALGDCVNQLFSMQYVTENHAYAGIKLSAAYQELFSLDTEFSYHTYRSKNADDSYDYAWYKPRYQLDARLRFHPLEKWTLSADCHWRAGRRAVSINNYLDDSFVAYTAVPSLANTTISSLDDLLLLSAELQYTLHRRCHLFVQLNNLLNQSYEIWEGCPSFGFTAMAGASISF